MKLTEIVKQAQARREKLRGRALLTRKVGGFAITMEMLFTIAIFAILVNATLFCLYVLNLQNAVYSIGANATMEVARWGGTNTNSYRINSYTRGYGNIVDRTNAELASITSEKQVGLTSQVNARVVDAGPQKISRVGQDTYMTIQFNYPIPFTLGGSFMGKGANTYTRTISFRIPSITNPGKLL